MPKVMWTGPEHVRIISKADLGDTSSDEVFEWSEATRWMQDMSDAEFEKLVELTGPGTWSTVEVTEAEPVEAKPKPKAKVTPAGGDDDSSSASGES